MCYVAEGVGVGARVGGAWQGGYQGRDLGYVRISVDRRWVCVCLKRLCKFWRKYGAVDWLGKVFISSG